MPGVLTDKGWVVFDTQKEADDFQRELEANKAADEAAKEEAVDNNFHIHKGMFVPSLGSRLVTKILSKLNNKK
ncbi:MAG: hypothetical protein A2X59_04395 [Nitrospirae bacterium GWC2_42_7]|nr:MAG: hypothetical protein A2X59_04395 [Nitrospirae bacterium GWC2_42_7]